MRIRRMLSSTTLRHLWAGLALSLALALSSLAPVDAQEPSTATGSLQLTRQTAWVTPGQSFTMDLAVSTSLPADQVDLVVTVFNGLRNRSSFSQTLSGRTTGSALILQRRPLVEVLDASGEAHVSLPVTDASQRQYFLRDNGVYPVRVELRETGSTNVIDELTTHLLNQQNTPTAENRLRTTVVLPLQIPFAETPTEKLSAAEVSEVLAPLTSSLLGHPDVPLSIAPSPETLERLASQDSEIGPIFDAFKSAASRSVVPRSTWAPIPTQLYDDLQNEAFAQLERGDRLLRSSFAGFDDKTFVSTDPLDAEALGRLGERGVSRLVIPESNLVPQARTTTLARPFVVSLGRGKSAMPAVHADVDLSRHFERVEEPVLSAHQLLADLAVIWNDRPGQQRGVVVMPPRDWKPSSLFLSALLEGLETSPVLAPSSLSEAFSVPPEGGARAPLAREMDTSKAVEYDSSKRISDGRQRLRGLTSIVGSDGVVSNDLERRLLYVESSELNGTQHSSQLELFETTVERLLDAIRMPEERSLQLTARTGEMPVSIQNDTGTTVHLRLQLISDKLDFPDGASRDVTVDRQNITVPFSIDARTSGAFPVQVRLTSPDGSLIVAESRIVVRSTAASGIGLGLSMGAGTFLILWWAGSALRSRRKRRDETRSPVLSSATEP